MKEYFDKEIYPGSKITTKKELLEIVKNVGQLHSIWLERVKWAILISHVCCDTQSLREGYLPKNSRRFDNANNALSKY